MNKRVLTPLLATLACCVLIGAGDDGAKRKDLEPLQGEWQMVSCEIGGNPLPEQMAKTGIRVVKGEQIDVHVGGMLIMKAKISVDAAKSPKTIDYVVEDGNHKGKTVLGIYELDGDT